MKELYILDSCYNPTAAATNRLLAYGLALQKKGVQVTYFYLFPFKGGVKCDRYTDKLNFRYLWEGAQSKNKYFNTIRSMRLFYKLMTPEIPVYVYSLLNCVHFLRLKKGIQLFHEYTENPEVIGKLGGIVGKFLYKLYIRAIPKLDGLFLITPVLREKYINEFGAKPEKTFILNMIVDSHRFDNLADITLTKTISYCGILSEYKDGVSILIKAFAIVISHHPEYKLHLIGPFKDSDTEIALKSLVAELNLNDNVIFAGAVSPDKMPSMLKSASILALARPDNTQSKYGFATKIGEYLMTERPIVLTNVGAVECYLEDKINCILASPDYVEDFANKLLWTIDNYDQAAEIGAKGKEAANKYFNSEKEAEKIYNALYHLDPMS